MVEGSNEDARKSPGTGMTLCPKRICPKTFCQRKYALRQYALRHYAPRQYAPRQYAPRQAGVLLGSITVHLTPLWGCVTTEFVYHDGVLI